MTHHQLNHNNNNSNNNLFATETQLPSYIGRHIGGGGGGIEVVPASMPVLKFNFEPLDIDVDITIDNRSVADGLIAVDFFVFKMAKRCLV